MHTPIHAPLIQKEKSQIIFLFFLFYCFLTEYYCNVTEKNEKTGRSKLSESDTHCMKSVSAIAPKLKNDGLPPLLKATHTAICWIFSLKLGEQLVQQLA